MTLREGAIEAAEYPLLDTLAMVAAKWLRIDHEEAMQREDIREAAHIVTAASMDLWLDYLEAHADELPNDIWNPDRASYLHPSDITTLIGVLRSEKAR